nr:divergent polysaccharide deacetylase family protein [Pseudomonadota bacterium]
EWVKKHYKKRNENEDIKLCVIINNFGMNNKVTRSILRIIRKEFSIAISPYQKLQKNSLDYMKREGHEELYIQPVMPYRETHSTQDPYRMYMEYDSQMNKGIVLKSSLLIPESAIAVILDETTPLLKDKNSLNILLDALKEKKLSLVSPEMPIDDEARKICENASVPFYQADYNISKFLSVKEVSELLNRLKDLLQKTGYALLVVDADIEKVVLLMDWLQLLLKDGKIKLISFKEVMCDEKLS